jgi:hypothetical protein
LAYPPGRRFAREGGGVMRRSERAQMCFFVGAFVGGISVPMLLFPLAAI